MFCSKFLYLTYSVKIEKFLCFFSTREMKLKFKAK